MARGTPKQADAGPAILIMARAPRRGEVRRALEPVLGADGCLALQSALLVLTSQWARALEPRSIHIAHDPQIALRHAHRTASDSSWYSRMAMSASSTTAYS